MKILTKLLNLKTDDELFDYFKDTLKVKGITQWNYFVNWEKVYKNVVPFEKELNLLNVLIGKDDIKSELTELILEYPKVVNAIPHIILIVFGVRECKHFAKANNTSQKLHKSMSLPTLHTQIVMMQQLCTPIVVGKLHLSTEREAK